MLAIFLDSSILLDYFSEGTSTSQYQCSISCKAYDVDSKSGHATNKYSQHYTKNSLITVKLMDIPATISSTNPFEIVIPIKLRTDNSSFNYFHLGLVRNDGLVR
jgi:hypothetical protein